MTNPATLLRHSRNLAMALLMPAFLLGGCGSRSNAELAEQVAMAKAAADRAVQAQHAAEKAAANAGARMPPSTFGDDNEVGDSDNGGDVDSGSSGDVISDGPPPPPPGA